MSDPRRNPDWETVDHVKRALAGDADFVLSMMASTGVVDIRDVRQVENGDWLATIRIKR